MKYYIKNIMKEKIIRVILSKREVKTKIIKSIYQNNNIPNFIKIYSYFQYNRLMTKKSHISKKHKICFLTGKRSGVVNGFSFSRCTIKKLILANKLTNIKKNNW